MQHQPQSGCGLPRNQCRNRFAVELLHGAWTQRSREARQRWAGGRNRFAVVGAGAPLRR